MMDIMSFIGEIRITCKFITFTLTIIRKEKKNHFIYVYNLNFFDEIKKDKNLHHVKGKTKKKTKIIINSPTN